MITIVDYGLGNLSSVRNALLAAGTRAEFSSDPAAVARASALVLPGVGAAALGMERLQERGLDKAIKAAAAAGTPILGICLGLQLLFDESDEGGVRCLGLVPGGVRLIHPGLKVPQIGWNQVSPQGKVGLWQRMPQDPYFYFVHSYVCDPVEPSAVAGLTTYGETFCSAVAHGSIWGTQFHPERSGPVGLRLLRNFVETAESSRRLTPADLPVAPQMP